jgi:hypothetical protein
MSIQPGNGYTFTSSKGGVSLNIDPPFIQYDGNDGGSAGMSLELLSIFPFKIAKQNPANAGDWTDLLAYLATAAAELTPYTLVPQEGASFQVLPGTINGVVCSLGPTACASGDPTVNVYLQTYPSGSENIFTTTSTMTDTDSAAYVLLGSVDYSGKTQVIMNSLVMERFKCGDNDAVYWYSKI